MLNAKKSIQTLYSERNAMTAGSTGMFIFMRGIDSTLLKMEMRSI